MDPICITGSSLGTNFEQPFMAKEPSFFYPSAWLFVKPFRTLDLMECDVKQSCVFDVDYTIHAMIT